MIISIKDIPSDWNLVKLGDISELKGRIGWRGYTIEDLRDHGPLVIGATQISPNHKINLSDPVHIAVEKYEESPEIQVKVGDILLVKTGNTIGKCAIIKDFIGEACINPNTLIIRNYKCDGNFLYQYMTSSFFQKEIWSWVAIGAQPSVNQENIKQIIIPLPKENEQQQIAQILSTWDKAIDKTEQLIQGKTQLKKGLLQILLTGNKRFKGFVISEKYTKTIFGNIPSDWAILPFKEIADKKVKWSLTGGPFGSNLKAEHYTNQGIRIIQLQNIGDGEFLDEYKIFTSNEKADELKSCNIYPGEIIISKMGDPVARACFIPALDDRYLMASDGIRLVPDKEQFDFKFVKEFINFKLFRNAAKRASTGSTRQRIGLDDLKKLPFIKLPLAEQQMISSTLAKLNDEISLLKKQVELFKVSKNALMQKLFTGEKRIKSVQNE